MKTCYKVVTTFNATGYEHYASRMIDTFLAHWPKTVTLTVYAESCRVHQTASNLEVLDFDSALPAAVVFKQRWQSDPRATGQLATGPADRKGKQPGIGFKWDAVRFSHKVYAVCDHARRNPAAVTVWMDADTVCHTPITENILAVLIPSGTAIAYLGRGKKYSECGLYALDMRDPVTQHFVTLFQNAYDEAEFGIFTMQEWHDSFVFDELRKRMAESNPSWRQLDWSRDLVDGEGHPLINSRWGDYLDHLKGDRKDLGRSKTKDLKVAKQSRYWKDHV